MSSRQIQQIDERFATCGDYLKGIARLRCTNPDYGHDHFRRGRPVPSPVRDSTCVHRAVRNGPCCSPNISKAGCCLTPRILNTSSRTSTSSMHSTSSPTGPNTFRRRRFSSFGDTACMHRERRAGGLICPGSWSVYEGCASHRRTTRSIAVHTTHIVAFRAASNDQSAALPPQHAQIPLHCQIAFPII